MLSFDDRDYNWKEMTDEEGIQLCQELRQQLVKTVAQTGGHLASNLGAVELTVALHRVYDTARDRLVFDVGHQCYIHKMLTGRSEQMRTIRKFGGLAGFPKPTESEHDAFVAGHASNSISVALGMARARTLLGEDYNVVALIGDGAMTGGLAYEGLCNAGQSGEKMIVIVNDNGMSIKKNVGGMAQLLARHHLRPQYLSFKNGYKKAMETVPGGENFYDFTSKVKKMVKGSLLPSSMFEDLGFTYLGPMDGHDLSELTRILEYAKSKNGPVLIHVRTQKGKGYQPAEKAPHLFHGVSPFEVKTGNPLKKSGTDFSEVFGKTLTQIAETNHKVCAVTAAMQSGTGLESFAAVYPDRCFDVGIAEGHAVSMCGGMAKQGAVPVFAVYSTFLQRSYDMLFHDVALSNLHVVFGVDRSGLVGADGETHQGLYDVAYLSSVPGMTILSPSSFAELERDMKWAVEKCSGPVAVRYPRGGENRYSGESAAEPVVQLRTGRNVTIVSYGITIGDALAAGERLDADVMKLNRLLPLAPERILESVRKTGNLIVVEETARQGCMGERLCSELLLTGTPVKKVRLLNCGEQFVQHGSVEQLRKLVGIDEDSIVRAGLEMLENE